MAAALGVPVRLHRPVEHGSAPDPLTQAAAGLVLVSEEVALALRPIGAVLVTLTDSVGRSSDDSCWERVCFTRRERLTELIAGVAHARLGRVLGVVAASGGLGATTLSGALAAAAPGDQACLLDLDPVGAGFDPQFGTEGHPGLRWDDFAGLDSPLAGPSVLERLVAVGRLRLLGQRCAPAAVEVDWQARRHVLRAVRGESTQVIADLGHSADPRLWPELDAVILLVGSDPPGVLAGARWVHRLSRVLRPVGVVLAQRGAGGVPVAQARDVLDAAVIKVWRPGPRPSVAAARGDWPTGLDRGAVQRVANRCWDWLGRVR